ncbi:hypothetical protein K505DRAFT_118800 [Melanomma pulvis-pyrius CBS 109.77]|uniref:Uncharacterized protein n=1 Tax=Melanomma pulvis-pyrius CBS 109.77 TaxID=1314802 RepID=A0A6A6WVK2_9PLEO|nr:hypothetical protein K505DRAFT_118800 [Melanomma pulvis-pyrius CBS 109.77]
MPRLDRAIEGHALWIEQMLRDTFATMPALIHNQALAKSGGGSSTVPSVAEKELAFAVDHVYASEMGEAESRYLNLSSSHIARFIRMFGWIGLKGALPEYPDRPVAVIVVEAGHNLIDKIEAMYLTEHCRRWHRLCTEPCWMFADTFYLATNWHRVMEALTENLATIEVLVYKKALPVIALARVLHMDIATTIELREYLRAHKETVERIHSCTKERYTIETPVKRHRSNSILPRLTETCQVLEHHERVISTVREQLDNLLSLLFNIETVEQGKTVTRLSALAFVFIPLSYVATLFGMTELHVSPRWYAATGPPVLIITLIGAFGFVKLLGLWEQYSTKSAWSRRWPRGVPSVSVKNQEIDIEKLSRRTPTLESMRFKPQNKMPITHTQPEKEPDAHIHVSAPPSTITPPKPLNSGPPPAKNDTTESTRASRDYNRLSPISEPTIEKSTLDTRDDVSTRPIDKDHGLGSERLRRPLSLPSESSYYRSSSATLGFRRTVGTASEIERRLRMIREEGITARDEPSRLVLQGWK